MDVGFRPAEATGIFFELEIAFGIVGADCLEGQEIARGAVGLLDIFMGLCAGDGPPDDGAVGIADLLENRKAGHAGEEEDVGLVGTGGEGDFVDDTHCCGCC